MHDANDIIMRGKTARRRAVGLVLSSLAGLSIVIGCAAGATSKPASAMSPASTAQTTVAVGSDHHAIAPSPLAPSRVDPSRVAPTSPACARLSVNNPQMINGAIRWTGTATNCSDAMERIVVKGSDVTGASLPGCTLAPFSYGLPPQPAGQTVPWFMTSKGGACAGSHVEEVEASVGSSPAAAVSQRITFLTT